jgi:gliding motility-associated lipoprotein GldH
MRITLFVTVLFILSACDSSRIYEKNHEFAHRWWTAAEQPQFDFAIAGNTQPYTLYFNVRNESDYPYANLYITYRLLDSAGRELQQKLVTEFLFDRKTGKPLGRSGIGDIFDHRFPLLTNYTFPYSGNYAVRFEHFMRTDTLKGVLAVGVRVEKAASN